MGKSPIGHPAGHHEAQGHSPEPEGSSDRAFGWTFTGFFALVAAVPWLRHGQPRAWAIPASVAVFMVTWIRPAWLAPANRAWTRFGLLLSRVMSPVVLSVLFYAVITPAGIIMRVFGKRPLDCSFDPKSKSYWRARDPGEALPEPMRYQF